MWLLAEASGSAGNFETVGVVVVGGTAILQLIVIVIQLIAPWRPWKERFVAKEEAEKDTEAIRQELEAVRAEQKQYATKAELTAIHEEIRELKKDVTAERKDDRKYWSDSFHRMFEAQQAVQNQVTEMVAIERMRGGMPPFPPVRTQPDAGAKKDQQ
jgi:biopolymer transport protein ExbB/TolQ